MKTFFSSHCFAALPVWIAGRLSLLSAVFGGTSARGVGVRKEVGEGRLGLYLMCIVGKAK